MEAGYVGPQYDDFYVTFALSFSVSMAQPLRTWSVLDKISNSINLACEGLEFFKYIFKVNSHPSLLPLEIWGRIFCVFCTKSFHYRSRQVDRNGGRYYKSRPNSHIAPVPNMFWVVLFGEKLRVGPFYPSPSGFGPGTSSFFSKDRRG